MLKEYMDNLKTSRNGISSACLAERGAKTEDNPYGFDMAKPLSTDDVVVLSLTGEGEGLRNYNAHLKRVDEYVEELSPELGEPVRSVVAVVDYGKYHAPWKARELLVKQHSKPKDYQKELQSLPLVSQKEYASPQYVQDIFNGVFLNRISSDNGTKRLEAMKAAQNLRKVIVMTHCHGGYVALKLEEELKRKMTELGYKTKEQKDILKQLLVLSYAPDCPLGVSEAQTIAFSSACDYNTDHGKKIKDYLKYYDFGIAYFPDKLGNVFYCTQIDKRGIEGNPPPVYVAIDPEEWFNGMYKDRSDDTSHLGEHEFMGFRQYDNMSRGALQMRTYLRRIFKNALIHSLKQKKEDFTPLPSVARLAADNILERQVFFRAKLMGYKLWSDMQIETKIFRRKFTNDTLTCTLD